MEIWTILNKIQYKKYIKDGILFADSNEVHKCWVGEFESPNFIQSYQWLSDVMRKRKILNHEFPMWAWIKKPDMRKERLNFKHNEEIYIVKLEIPKKNLLISSFVRWHFVLSGIAIVDDEDDIDITSVWNQNNILNRNKIKNSWHKIFDENDKNDTYQACYNEIRPELVKDIRKYTVNNKKN